MDGTSSLHALPTGYGVCLLSDSFPAFAAPQALAPYRSLRVSSDVAHASWTARKLDLLIIPWKDGKPLIWDATWPDTYAPSHQDVSASGAGKVAERAGQAKCSKYALLQTKYTFFPEGIETSGAFGPAVFSQKI